MTYTGWYAMKPNKPNQFYNKIYFQYLLPKILS